MTDLMTSSPYTLLMLRPEERAIFSEYPMAVTTAALQFLQEFLVALDELPVTAKAQWIERLAAQQPKANRAPQRGVAVIPIDGIITPKDGALSWLGFGTSIEAIQQQYRQAMKDPSVAAVVFNIDSPGGSVVGVDELSQEIADGRSKKPTVAVANGLMASAAYWIGTAAGELVSVPSGDVGSIGVMQVHQDHSVAEEKRGVKSTIISAGKYKTELNPLEPLSKDGKQYLQDRVNEYYDQFTARVAENRGVDVSAVRNGFGEGRVVGAKAAVNQGMVDWIGSLDQAINRTARKVGLDVQTAATADVNPPVAEGPDVEVLRRKLALLGGHILPSALHE